MMRRESGPAREKNFKAWRKKAGALTALFLATALFLLATLSQVSLADTTASPGSIGINDGDDDDGFSLTRYPTGDTVDVTDKSEGYYPILYNNENGLPTSEANAIAQTSEGFLWIGCYSGLIRYDGNTFERMDSTTGIASVVSLYVDSQDRLWVGTNDFGAVVLEQDRETWFRVKDGLQSASVRAIAEDGDGFIYLATTMGVSVVSPDMTMTLIERIQIRDEFVRGLSVGRDGTVYGVTQKGAVFTLRGGQLTSFYDESTLGIPEIRTVVPDAKVPGYVFLGTAKSTVYYGKLSNNMEGAQAINTAPLNSVNTVSEIGGVIWICADNGIGYIAEGVFTPLSRIPMEDSVDSVLGDYQGNLWFTSSQQGVMKIVRSQFKDIFAGYDELEQEEMVVNTTCYLDGLLYIGTNRGLLVLSNDEVLKSYPLRKAVSASGEDLGITDLFEILGSVRIRSIIRDSGNRLWFSTYGKSGLLRLEDGVLTRFGTEDGLPSERIRTIAERTDGSYVVACTGGIAILEGDRIQRVFGEDYTIDNTEILTVTQGGPEDVIFGTDGGGIYVLRRKILYHIGTEDGLQSDVVMRVKRDATRNITWIVTSNSLAYMTDDFKVTTIKKFPYPNNFDIIQNSKDELWVLSSDGIYVVSAEEMLANGDISPLHYNRENGLTCVPTSNSYSDVTDDGMLYIAGSTGVVRVNINSTFETINNVKLAVPFLEADGKIIYPDKDGNFTIEPDVKRLTIDAYAYVYSLMNPQVTYILEGFDRTATTVSRRDFGKVVYTNLKEGKYVFKITLRDPNGGGEISYSVKILKKKAFHETILFRVLVVLGSIALVALIVAHYVLKKMRALQREQKRNRLLIREITEAFAKTIDMKDRYTRGHSTRVAEFTTMLAKELGYDEDMQEEYYNIALLHDVGKIGVPSSVLNKQGKLSDEEFAIIKSHPALGYEALKNISLMPDLALGAGAHHERPDGKGYPKGLKGDEIPRVAQVIAVADAFDAMYSNRPYRPRMNFEKVVSIIHDAAGTQLEQDVVDAFMRLVAKGEFRAPDDHGGGSTEDIDNIHKRQNREEAAHKRELAHAKEAGEHANEAEEADGAEQTGENAEGGRRRFGLRRRRKHSGK